MLDSTLIFYYIVKISDLQPLSFNKVDNGTVNLVMGEPWLG